MRDRGDLADGLSPGSIRNACAAIGMSDVSTRILVETASTIAGSAVLRQAAIKCAELVFEAGLPIEEAIARWPVDPKRTNLPAFFDPTVILAGYRRLSADHRRRGIPAEVTRATLRDLDLWMDSLLEATGAWEVKETAWIARHFTSRLFQLGRLQFEPRPMDLPFAVFTSRDGLAAAILAEGGRDFRPDGQFADADGESGAGRPAEARGSAEARNSAAARPGWTSRFVEDERGWRGCTVDAAGCVQRAPLDLGRDDWSLIARRGDPVLAVHIPASGRFNGPLTPEACAESFRRAIPFFLRHLPLTRPRLLTCTSWMLDPQLALHLPPDARLVSFQRFFRLVPVPGADDRQTLERVFGGPIEDWSRAPRDTSLRRIIADLAESGVRWRKGAGIMLARDAASA